MGGTRSEGLDDEGRRGLELQASVPEAGWTRRHEHVANAVICAGVLGVLLILAFLASPSSIDWTTRVLFAVIVAGAFEVGFLIREYGR